tara:strand:- start:1626 stop:2501 length:876 start_codon:yes stop_codon:yes gene_type:complete
MNQETAQQIALTVMKQKTIGIEIECYIPSEHRGDIDAAFTAQVNYNRERWNTTTRPYWKGIPDGSLNNPPRGYQGFEMIMPPLMPSEAFKQLELVLDVLNRYGAKVRKCCGLHVHCDAAGFTPKRLQYALNHYVKSEKAIDCLMPLTRRGDQEAMPTHKRYCRSTKEILDTAIDGGRIRSGGFLRYRKLNLTSFAKHGTLEYRHHAATLDFGKIVAWAAFCQSSTERCRTQVTRTESYNNPMHNVLLAIKWARHNLDGTLDPVNDASRVLIEYVIARMDHFGFGAKAPRIG